MCIGQTALLELDCVDVHVGQHNAKYLFLHNVFYLVVQLQAKHAADDCRWLSVTQTMTTGFPATVHCM